MSSKKRKQVTLEDLKGLVGSADQKSASVKHDDTWKASDGVTEWKGGEKSTETVSGSTSKAKSKSSSVSN